MAEQAQPAWAVPVCYAVGTFVAVAFATYAFVYGAWWNRKMAGKQSTEDFITARGTQNVWRIGWSFYAGAVGAWVIVAPSQYASFAGIVGLVVYAIASGLPILLIALFGSFMKQLPHVLSLSDFMGWRYGPIAKTIVFLVAMFNMCIALLAEYTTIGSIFSEYVGSVSYGIIIVVGVLTLAYTAYGGLAVSIATDMVQGVASVILTVVLTIFVAVTYRQQPIPSPLPPDLGPNFFGYIAIFTLTVSLISSTMFSEAVWQRVWASATPRALYGGAAVGFFGITCVVFLSGFGGWLAFVWGYASFEDETNPNTYLMQLLGRAPADVPARVDSWVGVFVVLLAVVMNEGALVFPQPDAHVSAFVLAALALTSCRVAVVVLNVPLLIIGTRGFAVLSLFLVGNLVTCCAIIPLVSGLVPRLRGFVTETAFVFGVVGGILGVTASGIYVSWMPGDTAGSFSAGANWAWYGNNYDWRRLSRRSWPRRPSHTFGARRRGRCGELASTVRRVWVLMRIPGMKFATATPHWSPDCHMGYPADAKLTVWETSHAGAGRRENKPMQSA
ncbi:hypothetical protein COO60DRAFT_1536931 [Scenedesmus sp. NREL 46B-D3]|nr:hypothetical protein COO60DRAFT_1536931 [Scenedesmus sp. NREL 46B-D3]